MKIEKIPHVGMTNILRITLYGKIDSNGNIEEIQLEQEISDKDWTEFKKLTEVKKREFIFKNGVVDNTQCETITVGQVPSLDNGVVPLAARSTYQHDYEYDAQGEIIDATTISSE